MKLGGQCSIRVYILVFATRRVKIGLPFTAGGICGYSRIGIYSNIRAGRYERPSPHRASILAHLLLLYSYYNESECRIYA